MKIDGTEYRIVEEIYEDGHAEYVAQYAINFILFKIWKRYIAEYVDYGYGSISYICCGETYEDCKEYLLKSIEKKKQQKLKNTIVKINYL